MVGQCAQGTAVATPNRLFGPPEQLLAASAGSRRAPQSSRQSRHRRFLAAEDLSSFWAALQPLLERYAGSPSEACDQEQLDHIDASKIVSPDSAGRLCNRRFADGP
jgi:hypothetical protein